MSDADSDDDTKLLCATCIGEAYLCQKVENEGEERTCSYCGTVGQCFTIEAVADLVETAFAQHYTRTNPNPDYGEEPGLCNANAHVIRAGVMRAKRTIPLDRFV